MLRDFPESGVLLFIQGADEQVLGTLIQSGDQIEANLQQMGSVDVLNKLAMTYETDFANLLASRPGSVSDEFVNRLDAELIVLDKVLQITRPMDFIVQYLQRERSAGRDLPTATAVSTTAKRLRLYVGGQ